MNQGRDVILVLSRDDYQEVELALRRAALGGLPRMDAARQAHDALRKAALPPDRAPESAGGQDGE